MSSLLIAWQLSGKDVLIVGGGEVASQRIDSILATDAHITVICPSSGLHSRAKRLIDEHPTRITHLSRSLSPDKEHLGWINQFNMVLTALDDVELSRAICEYCRQYRIPVNAADIPELCDFYFGSQIKDGPLQIMVSTNGKGPRLANVVKEKLSKALTGKEGQAIEKVGLLRSKLKERAPGVGGEVGRRRMRWMTKLCDEWDIEELAKLSDETMSGLLDEGWEKNRVPSPSELGLINTES